MPRREKSRQAPEGLASGKKAENGSAESLLGFKRKDAERLRKLEDWLEDLDDKGKLPDKIKPLRTLLWKVVWSEKDEVPVVSLAVVAKAIKEAKEKALERSRYLKIPINAICVFEDELERRLLLSKKEASGG